jgi:hypothetical protein
MPPKSPLRHREHEVVLPRGKTLPPVGKLKIISQGRALWRDIDDKRRVTSSMPFAVEVDGKRYDSKPRTR